MNCDAPTWLIYPINEEAQGDKKNWCVLNALNILAALSSSRSIVVGWLVGLSVCWETFGKKWSLEY